MSMAVSFGSWIFGLYSRVTHLYIPDHEWNHLLQ